VKIQVEDQKPCKKVLKISVPSETLKEAHKKVLSEFLEHSKIGGFRQGKAPVKMVETKFTNEIKSEVLKHLLPKVCNEAIQTEKIRVIGEPLVNDIDYNLDKGLTFQAIVEIFPKVDLPKYHGVKLQKDSVEVKDEELDKTIEDIREHHAVYQPVEGRALQLGDYASMDYQSVDARGKKDERKGTLIYVRNDDPSGLMNQLVGMQLGETRKAVLEATNEHPKIDFTFKLNEIKQKNLPDLNDEFFKTLGDVKNLDELRQKVRDDIKTYKERAAQEALRNKAIRLLADEADFDVPENQVSQEAQNIYSELVERVRRGAVSPKGLDDAKVKQDVEEEAKRRVKIAYILHEIAQKENIKASDEDVNHEINHMAERLGKTFEQLKSELYGAQRIEPIRARLSQDKVVDFIVQNAIIK